MTKAAPDFKSGTAGRLGGEKGSLYRSRELAVLMYNTPVLLSKGYQELIMIILRIE